MKTKFTDALQVIAAILITGSSAYAMQPPAVEVDSQVKTPAITQNQPPTAVVEPKAEPVPEPIVEEPPAALETVKPVEVVPEPVVAAPAPVGDNETIAWNFLIGQGYTRNQTAGIMGNLQQEHNFKTADVPGGLGIAQWMGGRRANLMARPNYLDINVQLQFLVDELNGVENAAKRAIVATDNVESSTMAFSSLFERCGTCHNNQRINYAYAILGRH